MAKRTVLQVEFKSLELHIDMGDVSLAQALEKGDAMSVDKLLELKAEAVDWGEVEIIGLFIDEYE